MFENNNDNFFKNVLMILGIALIIEWVSFKEIGVKGFVLIGCVAQISNGLFVREILEDIDEQLYDYFIKIGEISLYLGKLCSPFIILELQFKFSTHSIFIIMLVILIIMYFLILSFHNSDNSILLDQQNYSYMQVNNNEENQDIENKCNNLQQNILNLSENPISEIPIVDGDINNSLIQKDQLTIEYLDDNYQLINESKTKNNKIKNPNQQKSEDYLSQNQTLNKSNNTSILKQQQQILKLKTSDKSFLSQKNFKLESQTQDQQKKKKTKKSKQQSDNQNNQENNQNINKNELEKNKKVLKNIQNNLNYQQSIQSKQYQSDFYNHKNIDNSQNSSFQKNYQSDVQNNNQQQNNKKKEIQHVISKEIISQIPQQKSLQFLSNNKDIFNNNNNGLSKNININSENININNYQQIPRQQNQNDQIQDKQVKNQEEQNALTSKNTQIQKEENNQNQNQDDNQSDDCFYTVINDESIREDFDL